MKLILRGGGTAVTARKLGELLLLPVSRTLPREATFAVCWGADTDFEPNINGKSYGSKRDQLVTMNERGVRTIPFAGHKAWSEWLGRMNYHEMGRDIGYGEGVEGSERSEGSPIFDYYTKYIESDREIRVHVFNGRIIFRQERIFSEEKFDKLMRDTESILDRGNLEEYRDIIHNERFGWYYKKLNLVPNLVAREAKKAIESLGLTFGAVDTIMKGDEVYVLEVNKAPGLGNESAGIYAERIRLMMEGRHFL